MVRYAITDGLANSASGTARLVERAKRWAAEGIDFVQLREKTLPAGELLHLAEELGTALRDSNTKLLVNGRPDIAVAAEAAGVHLPGHPGELSPAQVRQVFAASRLADPVVSVSCHTLAEVTRATAAGADLILFGPVFEKHVDAVLAIEGVGLAMLRMACAAAGTTPLLALGGITPENALTCLDHGAAGVAAIRMFA